MTQIMNHNVILLTVCTGLLTDQLSYTEISVVPIGHGFSFLGHGKSVLEKRGQWHIVIHGLLLMVK